jgi:hypothetical protein
VHAVDCNGKAGPEEHPRMPFERLGCGHALAALRSLDWLLESLPWKLAVPMKLKRRLRQKISISFDGRAQSTTVDGIASIFSA